MIQWYIIYKSLQILYIFMKGIYIIYVYFSYKPSKVSICINDDGNSTLGFIKPILM